MWRQLRSDLRWSERVDSLSDDGYQYYDYFDFEFVKPHCFMDYHYSALFNEYSLDFIDDILSVGHQCKYDFVNYFHVSVNYGHI